MKSLKPAHAVFFSIGFLLSLLSGFVNLPTLLLAAVGFAIMLWGILAHSGVNAVGAVKKTIASFLVLQMASIPAFGAPQDEADPIGVFLEGAPTLSPVEGGLPSFQEYFGPAIPHGWIEGELEALRAGDDEALENIYIGVGVILGEAVVRNSPMLVRFYKTCVGIIWTYRSLLDEETWERLGCAVTLSHLMVSRASAVIEDDQHFFNVESVLAQSVLYSYEQFVQRLMLMYALDRAVALHLVEITREIGTTTLGMLKHYVLGIGRDEEAQRPIGLFGAIVAATVGAVIGAVVLYALEEMLKGDEDGDDCSYTIITDDYPPEIVPDDTGDDFYPPPEPRVDLHFSATGFLEELVSIDVYGSGQGVDPVICLFLGLASDYGVDDELIQVR